MSAHVPRAFLVLLVTAAPPAFAVDWVGIDGSTCAFDSIQAALDDPSTPTNLWIAEGVHEDPGFVVERDLIAHRGTSSCADGGASFATIDFDGAGSAIIENDVRATLHQIYFANGVATQGGNLRVDPGADVTVYQGGFLNGSATNGGGVAVMSSASFRTYGAVFTVNSASQLGGGVYADDGAEVRLESGLGTGLSFLGNSAVDGGGVHCDDCDLLISAPYGQTVWFWSNDATSSGGGVDVVGTASAVEIRDAEFEANTASTGGAISLVSTAAAVLDDLQFTANEAVSGGAVQTVGGGLELSSSFFSGNSATADGGGLQVFGTDLVATGLTFAGNAANVDGGALHAFSGTMSLSNSLVDDNDAVFGGGIALEGTSVETFDEVSFSGNAASNSGGAMSLMDGAVLPLTSCSFDENTAVNNGGAIFGADSDVDAVDTDWTGNSAAFGGAIFALASDTARTVSIDRGSLAENSATGTLTGSAIHVKGGPMTLSLRDTEAIHNLSTDASTAAIVGGDGATLETDFVTVGGNSKYGVVTLNGAAATLSCSIVWGNGTGGVFGTGTASHSDIQGVTWGAGSTNVNVNPQYVNATGGDFRLSATSPMRNFCDLAVSHTALNGVVRDTGADVTDAGAFDTTD